MAKILSAFLVLSALLFALPSDACTACGGWGRDWSARLDICADPSEALHESWVDCVRASCAATCALWLDAYDACTASGPPCQVAGDTEDCDLCMVGSPPYAGNGCYEVNLACSSDTTGCVSCAEWLGGGNIDNLCYAPGVSSLSAAIDLIACACSGACAGACAATMCPQGWLDLTLSPDDGCFQCIQDTGAGCGGELQVCSAL